MSRFDAWAKSSAEGDGLFRAWRRSREVDETDPGDGMTRRDVIKKGAILGGATLASSALIQSVTAPAFAATCVPACTTGFVCTAGPGGTGICTPVVGQPTTCSNSADCTAVGTCCSGSGATAGTCQSGLAADAVCSSDADCCSRKCSKSGNQATGTCARAKGAACNNDGQCASGVCKTGSPRTCA